MEAVPAWHDPQHARFTDECRGLKSQPEFRCGQLHDCKGHATDRNERHERVGPWRPCRNVPAAGSDVCRTHGGSAPQVIAAARDRLAAAAADAAGFTVDLINDADAPLQLRLRAAKDVQDRTVGRAERTPPDIVSMVRANPQLLSDLLDAIDADPSILEGTDRE